MLIHAVLLHLAMMRPVPPFVTTGKARSAPCTTGTCTFTWAGPAGQAINVYNTGFADLSPSHTMSAVTLDGAGHVQVSSFSNGGYRFVGSTSDTAQIVFSAAPGANNSLVKGLSVRSDGTGDGYAMEPCFGDGTGKWNKICIKKNGTELTESVPSSYDPTVDNTARLVVSGTTTVTISAYWNGTLVITTTDSSSPLPPGGNPGAYAGNGSSSTAQQQFGLFQDH